MFLRASRRGPLSSSFASREGWVWDPSSPCHELDQHKIQNSGPQAYDTLPTSRICMLRPLLDFEVYPDFSAASSKAQAFCHPTRL